MIIILLANVYQIANLESRIVEHIRLAIINLAKELDRFITMMSSLS